MTGTKTTPSPHPLSHNIALPTEFALDGTCYNANMSALPRSHRRFRASVTSKGQVTIPADVRRAMHVDAGDKVIFELTDDGLVTLQRGLFPSVASLAGAAGTLPGGTPIHDDRWHEAAALEVAEAFRRKLASGDA
jgi:antitoxin PrlF